MTSRTEESITTRYQADVCDPRRQVACVVLSNLMIVTVNLKLLKLSAEHQLVYECCVESALSRDGNATMLILMSDCNCNYSRKFYSAELCCRDKMGIRFGLSFLLNEEEVCESGMSV